MEGLFEIDYKEIKKWLGHGGIAALAREHGISRQHAYHILRGRVNNFKFYEEAIKRATDQKHRILSTMRQFQETA